MTRQRRVHQIVQDSAFGGGGGEVILVERARQVIRLLGYRMDVVDPVDITSDGGRTLGYIALAAHDGVQFPTAISAERLSGQHAMIDVLPYEAIGTIIATEGGGIWRCERSTGWIETDLLVPMIVGGAARTFAGASNVDESRYTWVLEYEWVTMERIADRAAIWLDWGADAQDQERALSFNLQQRQNP